jgi:hypothetical protein
MSGDATAIGPTRRGGFRAVQGAFPVGATLGAAAFLGAAGVLLLSTYRLSFIVCYFKLMTGLPCLTCGGTRAAISLLTLDPAGALAMNPLVTVAGLLLAGWAAADLVLLTRRRALRLELTPRAARLLRILAPLLVIANWAYLVVAGR